MNSTPNSTPPPTMPSWPACAACPAGSIRTGAILCGSPARGSRRPDSDIDVAVLLRGAPHDLAETRAACAALTSLALRQAEATGIVVHPLVVWESDLLLAWADTSAGCDGAPDVIISVLREGRSVADGQYGGPSGLSFKISTSIAHWPPLMTVVPPPGLV